MKSNKKARKSHQIQLHTS